MNSKVIFGVEKELALNDFLVDKLSNKLGLLELNGYRLVEKKVKNIDGIDVTVNVLSVQCVSLNTNKQVKVDLAYDGTNKSDLDVALAELKKNPFQKQFIDFEDVIVGHYIGGSGNFAMITQTYKANKVIRVDQKSAERIFRGDQPIQPTPQPNQQPNKG